MTAGGLALAELMEKAGGDKMWMARPCAWSRR